MGVEVKKTVRCLDQAALKESATSQNEQETKENVFTDTEVEKKKGIFRLIPMLLVFMAYCVVEATGSTFFFEQSTNLDSKVDGFKVPLSTFYLIQILADFTTASFYEYGVRKWWSKHQVKVMKVRIVLGIGCSFLCCGTAWLVEVRRLGLLKLVDQTKELENTTINMSICWLMPQFFLLGLTEGLTEDGLEDFFCYLLPASMEAYGPSFNQTVIGIGKLIIAILLFSFKSCFGSNINNSHLDYFYGMLAIALCLVSPLYITSLYFSVYPDIKGVEQSLEGRLEDRVTSVLTSLGG
ncbi:unnamed protein product [Ilex paraguariensis]|uniref:Uncharacterized protein n=1 Tax=Ilex paraguariensis TaxID=185542 RepID=A0ABC8S6L1_9AQUA